LSPSAAAKAPPASAPPHEKSDTVEPARGTADALHLYHALAVHDELPLGSADLSVLPAAGVVEM
jgi:hypothetical protein